MSVDHRALLKKYIEHVGDVEGSIFLGEQYRKSFTDEEYAELMTLVTEINEAWANSEAGQRYMAKQAAMEADSLRRRRRMFGVSGT